MAFRVSEAVNGLTTDLDVSSPEQIVRLLRQCDAQMFAGFGGWDGMLDDSTLTALCKVMVPEDYVCWLLSPRFPVQLARIGCGMCSISASKLWKIRRRCVQVWCCCCRSCCAQCQLVFLVSNTQWGWHFRSTCSLYVSSVQHGVPKALAVRHWSFAVPIRNRGW
jgi:hypothetical protein